MTTLSICDLCACEHLETAYVCDGCCARLRGLLTGVLDDVQPAPVVRVRTGRRDELGRPIYLVRPAVDGGRVVPGLASALEAAIRGELRFTAPGPSTRPVDAPLPLAPAAVFARDELVDVLRREADAIARTRGLFRPLDTLPALATWLATQVDWLSHRGDGAERIGSLTDAIRTARRVVEHRVDARHYRGVCPGVVTDDDSGETSACATHLYVRDDETTITCPRCGAEFDGDGRRRELLAAARRTLVTATEAARALQGLGLVVKPSTIRSWVHRGKLRPGGYTPAAPGRPPYPTYRLGEVQALAQREATSRAVRLQRVARHAVG